MTAFRVYLAAVLAGVVAYTAVTIALYGWNFFPTAFGDVFGMTWQKQFNIDFLGFLSLSALWTAWRNNFSPLGLVLAVLAFFGGIIFLSVYLLALSLGAKGDVAVMMMGERRAGAGR
jgi:hypothetical protein